MSYESDLKELKRRVITVAVFFVIAFVFFYYYSPQMMDFITLRGQEAGYKFIYINPAEVLVQQLKIACVGSLIAITPILIIEAALFIGPGLDTGIAGIIIPSVFACIMFILGILFSYLVLVPFVFGTLYDLGVNSNIVAQVTIENYISLYLTLLVSLGVVFELPLVSLGLTKFGILSSDRMKNGRKVAIVISLLLAALITPPDIFSQLVVALPIMVLYEFSIVLCKLVESRKEDAICDSELQN